MDENFEALSAFVHTARYAQFLLDEPLTRIASSTNHRRRPDFQHVVEECENLAVSIKCLLRKLEVPEGAATLNGGAAAVVKNGQAKKPAGGDNKRHTPSISRPTSPRPLSSVARSLSMMSMNSNRGSGFKRSASGARGSLRETKSASKEAFGRKRLNSSRPASLMGDSQSDDCKSEMYMFQNENVEINGKFVELCKKLNSNEASSGYYCRPCFAMCPNEKEWIEHCGSRAHDSIFKKIVKNIMSSCNKCPVKVIASRLLATSYIRYHIKVNHPEITESECFHFYELSQPQSNLTHQDRKSNHRPTKNGASPIQASSYSPADTNETRRRDERPPSNSSFSPATNNTTTAAASQATRHLETLLLDVFTLKKSVIDGENQPFHGICLICVRVIDDVFEFMQHQMEHGPKVQAFDCDTCNLTLCGFGDNGKRLLNHPLHDEVDDLVTSCR